MKSFLDIHAHFEYKEAGAEYFVPFRNKMLPRCYPLFNCICPVVCEDHKDYAQITPAIEEFNGVPDDSSEETKNALGDCRGVNLATDEEDTSIEFVGHVGGDTWERLINDWKEASHKHIDDLVERYNSEDTKNKVDYEVLSVGEPGFVERAHTGTDYIANQYLDLLEDSSMALKDCEIRVVFWFTEPMGK